MENEIYIANGLADTLDRLSEDDGLVYSSFRNAVSAKEKHDSTALSFSAVS